MDHLRDELLRKNLWNEEDNKVYEQVRSVMINELENHNSKTVLLHGDLWAVIICFKKMGVRSIQPRYMEIGNLT